MPSKITLEQIQQILNGEYSSSYIQNHRDLSHLLGCKADLLDFSTCLTGTHKIVKASEALGRPLIKKYKKLPFSLISSGNYAYAVKIVADALGIRGYIVIDTENKELKEKLSGKNTTVYTLDEIIEGCYGKPSLELRITDKYELWCDRLISAIHHLTREKTYNITNMDDICRGQAYSFFDENHTTPRDPKNSPLYRLFSLSHVGRPDYIFCPTGSGELLFSIALEYFPINSPKIYGIVPEGHPLITRKYFDRDIKSSFVDKLETPTAPIMPRIDSLNNYKSQVREYINGIDTPLPFYRQRKYIFPVEAKEEEFKKTYELSQELGIDAEPSGAAGLVALLESFRDRNKLVFKNNDHILIVNTGNGMRDIN